MFDLERELRDWRRETEATLAFSSEEIDELADHLRLSFAAKLQDGVAPEQAWRQSLNGLGPASALAVEFAKEKLMPALGRLLVSWWRPALLAFLFGLTFVFSFQQGLQEDNRYLFAPWVSETKLWGTVWLGLLVTLLLLSNKTQKNAVLAGIGNAFGLIPLLHILFYNSLTEKFVGTGWSQMAASFGWLPLSLSLVGLFVVNLWWWKRSKALGEKLPLTLAVSGTLVLVLTLSPFLGEGIGNLSIREVYSMPTISQVTFTGETRSDFLKWKFVEVLISSVLYIANILPFGLVILISAGICLIQMGTRKRSVKVVTSDDIFPSLSTLPWMMTLGGSGLCWVWSHSLEPNFSEELRQAAKSVSYTAASYGGMEILILLSAFLFFVCGWELTKKLARASRIRPFYAAMLVVVELAVALGLPAIPALIEMTAKIADKMAGIPPRPPQHSTQPEWLTWVLGFAIVTMAFYQAWLIARKLRDQPGQVSLWKFEGKNLVELGLLLGLIFACCGLILYMVAIVMAFESVSVIGAMIAWGNSIKDPVKNHFYPQMYGTPDHLGFWVASGISYLSLCLCAGLGVVIMLSALEFIRFNGYRLYKMRKLRQAAQTLAVNE